MNLIAGLYIVSTPIGNLSDITLRALSVLDSCDIIYCEDTRFTSKLLQKHNINNKKLAIYNDHSSMKTREIIASKIKSGHKIALVSDAGTPMIADPGYKLIEFLQEQQLHIDVVPGVCAVIGALTLSGLPTDQFFFAGFIPKTKAAKNKLFAGLVELPATLIFYDTASRIVDSLISALEVFGDRLAVVVREISKLYQRVYKQNIKMLLQTLTDQPIRGEIVVLISGIPVNQEVDQDTIVAAINDLKSKNFTTKDAIAKVLSTYPNLQLSRKELYKLAHR